MAIGPGVRLGPYEIIALLGAGGMGEVYRARDSKLNRDVALKILPDAFATDPDRLARFRREAQVLASLNHPHIAAIYDFEDSGSTHALVLELVEGPTLADRIAQGPMPIAEALGIAKQIAEALEAAHEQGIVHRDLKPANIKLRDDGTVKVLDFGLAKALEPEAASRLDVTNAATITTPAMTGVGVILGTAAYMSPEQAKGRPADKRSDVWAFGCVLYEMLSGIRPFAGEGVAETIAYVITKEPDWTTLPPAVPELIRLLLRQCLEKDPRQRVGAISAARFALAAHGGHALASPVAAASGRRSLLITRIVAAAALAALVAAAVPLARHVRETPAAETRVDINTPATPTPLEFALSPDGRQIAFIAAGDGPKRLWVRALDQSAARPLAGTDDASMPFWSPDSRSIAYFAASKLSRIDVAGGSPRTVADVSAAFGGTWGPDGTILFGPSSGGIQRISALGGERSAVTQSTAGRLGHRFPQFLPDGRHFLYYVAGSAEASGLYLGSLDGGEPKRLVPTDGSGVFLPPDHVVYSSQGALVARRLDVSRGVLTGEPRILGDAAGASGLGLAGLSASLGQIAYRRGTDVRTQLTWFSRDGTRLGVVNELDTADLKYPALSPDGRYVAAERTVQNNPDIWLIDLVRHSLARFTVDAAQDTDPIWSPDGTQLAFTSNRVRSFSLYTGPFIRPGTERPLQSSVSARIPQDWSSDGRFLLYYELNADTGRDLMALEFAKLDKKPIVVANSPFEDSIAQFSPDGRWVAYQTNSTGRFEIFVQPFPSPTARWQVSADGGVAPRWRGDGKEIYFVAPDGSMMAAAVTASTTTFDTARPIKLFPARMLDGGSLVANRPQYAITRDGRFLVNQVVEETPAPITLILNVKL